MIHLDSKPLPEKWMKAAVVGSLWATVEIVLGSLLHNLKVPLAGSILSFVTVYLVISFFQIWKTNGIIWRAGIICALMKSISPSAFILGPMIGIFSEALILEFIIRSFGKNPFAYAIGGALAVFSALAQKAATLLILYGWDIVLLLENMYMFAAGQLRIEAVKPEYLLIIISLIYLVGGAVAGISGYHTGKGSVAGSSGSNKLRPVSVEKKWIKSDLFKYTRKHDHSIPLLFLNLLLLIGGMFIITYSGLIISVIYAISFTTLTVYRYKQNVGFLKKPALWLQLALILLFSAIFHDGFSRSTLFQYEGFAAGVQMILRALVLLSGFSAVSSELKNPVIKNILYNRGLKHLYQSLELSFSALPGIMKTFSIRNSKISGFRRLVYDMLLSSQQLLEEFIGGQKDRPPVFVISGKVKEGKTTRAKEIVTVLQEKGINVSGFFSARNIDEANREVYYLEDIASDERQLLCSQNETESDIRSGRFYFSEKGLAFGNNLLLQCTLKQTDLIVIDELGPLEMNDKGWSPAVEHLLNQTRTPQLWVVRESLVRPMTRKWHVGDVYIFNLNEDTKEDIVECIIYNLMPSTLELSL